MARPGLLKKVFLSDPVQDRFQANVSDALDVVTADHDILSAPVLPMAASGIIGPGRSVVVYLGNPGATLTLPLAASQGQSTSAIVLVVNVSGGEITVRPAGNNTVNGALGLTLAALSMVILASDGITKWTAASALTEDRVKILASYHP